MAQWYKICKEKMRIQASEIEKVNSSKGGNSNKGRMERKLKKTALP